MKTTALLLILLLTEVAQAKESLRLPTSSSGTVTLGEEWATVQYPFGTVDIPRDSLKKMKSVPPKKGQKHGQTKGRFVLSYKWVLAGEKMTAVHVRVRVENRVDYFSSPTERLKEHEDMHRRINTAEAQRIEKVLSGFSVSRKMSKTQAEQKIKETFQKEINNTRRLHAEWDNNHVFISTTPLKL